MVNIHFMAFNTSRQSIQTPQPIPGHARRQTNSGRMASDIGFPPEMKVLDKLRYAIRSRHYSYRTEQAYVFWVGKYIMFHAKGHPQDMEPDEIRQFINHHSVHGQCAASTIRLQA